jgi:ABC-type sugar transport system permease subunit
MEGQIAEWTGDVMIEALSKILGWDGGKNFTMAAQRSFQVYAIGLFIGTPLGLLFSYYIYKKLPFSGLFRVLLFMPSIISGIVMVAMFKFFVQDAVPIISEELFGTKMKIGWLSGRSPADTKFATIMFFNTWAGFGGGVLMYSNAMSGTSQEVVESAHLDGAVGIREFIYITSLKDMLKNFCAT